MKKIIIKDDKYLNYFQNHIKIYKENNEFIIKDHVWTLSAFFNLEINKNNNTCQLNIDKIKEIKKYLDNNQINYCLIDLEKNEIIFETFNDKNSFDKLFEKIETIKTEAPKHINNVNEYKQESHFVKLYKSGNWYNVYDDDAKVLAYVTDYKLFQDSYTLKSKVGFPIYLADKTIACLENNYINYCFVDDQIIKDYGEKNNYIRFLKNDLPFSYVVNGEKRVKEIKGTFKVKFEDEQIEEFEVGENINQEAELVQLILKHDVGETIILNDEKIEIIEKNIN